MKPLIGVALLLAANAPAGAVVTHDHGIVPDNVTVIDTVAVMAASFPVTPTPMRSRHESQPVSAEAEVRSGPGGAQQVRRQLFSIPGPLR